ncbi:MAG: response regulator [Pedobacter sp.]|nr:response regulator [Pedobacter sp.]
MTLLNTQTIKARTRIHHLGLPARDLLVVQSMFRIQADLAERYVFGDSSTGDLVDLVFVNADDHGALASWERLRQQRPEVVPIMVSDHERRSLSNVWVQRPLDFRNFSSLLDAITSADINRPGTRDLPLDSGVLRVLVVDDSFPARQFIKIKLEEQAAKNQMQVAIDFADSGERALEVAAGSEYDVVFLDVEMSGMDGFETCAQLKKVRPRLRVAMLTGKVHSTDFQRGRAAGCDNYLAKPPNDADLRTVLHLTSFKKITLKK